MGCGLEVACAQCGTKTRKAVGAVNRAKKIGAPIYCGRSCFGLAHRRKVAVTAAELIERKRLYDMEYRRKNRATLKEKKSAYYQATRDPERERERRKANMPRHVEYCRRPEYKAWKREYDKQYRAKSDFGPFWESALVLADLDTYLEPLRYDAMWLDGRLNKCQRRKRECQTKFNSLPRI